MGASIGLAAGGALLGAIAGGQKDRTRSTETSTVNLQDFANLSRGQSGLEKQGYQAQLDEFKKLQDLLSGGPGQAEVTGGFQAQQDFAAQLQNMIAQGGMPSQAQVSQAQQFAGNVFAPQRQALQSAFQDQDIASQRLAARLGRSGADPILRAKLAQEQTRQLGQLEAQQGSFAAQTAQGMPQQQLQLGEALANIRGGLGAQALQNRQTLLSLGQQLAQQERNYRLQAAGRTTTGTQTSGGGLAGAISGGLAGAGAGFNLAGNIGSMFGGAGGGVAAGGAGASGAIGAPRRMGSF